MKSVRIALVAGFVAIALVSSSQGQEARGRSVPEAGIVLGDESKGELERGLACSLFLSPTETFNGGIVSIGISYDPCDTRPHTETFTFLWPTTLPGFRETTTRQKIFRESIGCVSSSGEIVAVPTAGAIVGEAIVTVESRNTNTGRLLCRATGRLTITQ
jgi:hypothetical protein